MCPVGIFFFVGFLAFWTNEIYCLFRMHLFQMSLNKPTVWKVFAPYITWFIFFILLHPFEWSWRVSFLLNLWSHFEQVIFFLPQSLWWCMYKFCLCLKVLQHFIHDWFFVNSFNLFLFVPPIFDINSVEHKVL